jgi:branched-chain amino acid transport system ATP-binding protein
VQLLSVSEVEVRFGGLRALEGVGLNTESGMVHGLIGPNGAGKTTFFNVICGLQKPARGTVLFKGEDITDWPPYKRARAGIARTFQRSELFHRMTVRENLLAAWEGSVPFGTLGWRRREGAEFVDATLEHVGLSDVRERPAGQLSTGLARLVELGRALCTRPAMLLLDEPGSGLSPEETARLGEVLKKIVGAEGDDVPGILLVEHHMELVLDVSAIVTVLDFGRVLAVGTPSEIRSSPAVIEAYLGSDEDAA